MPARFPLILVRLLFCYILKSRAFLYGRAFLIPRKQWASRIQLSGNPTDADHHDHEFDIVDHVLVDPRRTNNTDSTSAMNTVLNALVQSGKYPSRNQAKKACLMGAVVLCGSNNSPQIVPGDKILPWEWIHNTSGILSHFDSLQRLSLVRPHQSMHSGDLLVLIQRRPNSQFYPVETTKYILHPLLLAYHRPTNHASKNYRDDSHLPVVIYQDGYLALLQKPENLSTINIQDPEDDLQSLLGFLLTPPSNIQEKINYPPRPVHRLDRSTSGLVLVAKTADSMRLLSQAFAERRVLKTYTARVFGSPSSFESIVIQQQKHIQEAWQTIDYPIDDKPAISRYRIEHVDDDDADLSNFQNITTTTALVQVQPHTGRMHQIRRHLSYCLKMPIVGDAKYDYTIGNVGRSLVRENGMYLCCHALEFPYPWVEGEHRESSFINSEEAMVEIFQGDGGSTHAHTRMKVRIPLPRKFSQVIANNTERQVESKKI